MGLAKDIRTVAKPINMSAKNKAAKEPIRQAFAGKISVQPDHVYCTFVGAPGNAQVRLQKQVRDEIPFEAALVFCAWDNLKIDDEQIARIEKHVLKMFDVVPSIDSVIIFAESKPGNKEWDPVRCYLRDGAPTGAAIKAELPGVDVVNVEKKRPEPLSESDLADLVRAYRNVIIEGVSGSGKTFAAANVAEEFGSSEFIVFHPETSYQDFIEGIQPVANGYEVRDGLFLELCKQAASDPKCSYVIIIDEINRANTAKVFGDLLYAIEPSARVDCDTAGIVLANEHEGGLRAVVRLQLDRGDGLRQEFCVPENVFIVGTMNTTDRSVGSMDLALRRRFAFVRKDPLSGEVLAAELDDDSWVEDIKAWEAINELFAEVSADALLGHAYFFEAQELQLQAAIDGHEALWAQKLLPQIAEILVSFEQLELIDEVNACVSEVTSLGLVASGHSLDRFPVVQELTGSQNAIDADTEPVTSSSSMDGPEPAEAATASAQGAAEAAAPVALKSVENEA